MSANSYIEWPADLPLPALQFAGQSAHAIAQTDIPGGGVTRRRRATPFYATLEVSWALSEAQLANFEDFVTTSLSNGTSQFRIHLKHPLNSALTNWAVRLLPDYQVAEGDGTHSVQALLELVRQFED